MIILLFLFGIWGILLGKSLNVPKNISTTPTLGLRPTAVPTKPDATTNWKTYNFSPTISFKIPSELKGPRYVNAGNYAKETNLPGNTSLQIWGDNGASPSGGKDYYDEIRQDIVDNKVFETKFTTLSNKEAIQFTSSNPTSDEIMGGEIALELRGILVKMDDGLALVAIHYKGQTLQKDGDFGNDEKVFDQILSTFKFLD